MATCGSTPHAGSLSAAAVWCKPLARDCSEAVSTPRYLSAGVIVGLVLAVVVVAGSYPARPAGMLPGHLGDATLTETLVDLPARDL